MTDMELAEEIERLSREFEALAANKGGKIEHRAVAAAKLESTLMVNRDRGTRCDVFRTSVAM